MTDSSRPTSVNATPSLSPPGDEESSCSIERLPVCPVCGGNLIDIRMKRQCARCHTICETCCEGGRG